MRSSFLGLVLLGLAMPVFAASWGYDGAQDPAHWGKLSAQYSLCDTGRNQSPVDIHGALSSTLAPLDLRYQASPAAQITHNGHTIQVDFRPGNALVLDGERFKLAQMHFHAPAEHTIDGRHYPLEAHLVHANARGDLAVLGILFEAGAPNSSLTRLWAHMPARPGVTQPLPGKVWPHDLLPAKLGYYRLTGSLTTPPCSEGVRWLILENPVSASADQIEAFRRVMGQATNRPVQPLNGRVIVH